MYNYNKRVGVDMMKNDKYQKIYELLESDFFHAIIKRGRNFGVENSEIFLYVDITDFDEFNFSSDEENFLVDCLRQMEIKVFNRDGNEYVDDYQEKIRKDNSYKYVNKSEVIEKILLYRKNKDINLRNEIVLESMLIVEKVARKIADEYQLSYDELVQMGAEYLIYIVDEYDLEKIEDFYHYVYMRMMKYLLRKVISTFDNGSKNKKIIRDYLDAKKNVESVYGQSLDENPQLMEEIIDLMIEEYGNGNKMFSHSEKLLDYNKKLSPNEYSQLIENDFRNTSEGVKYRNDVNANLEPLGIEELLQKFELVKDDKYELFDTNKIITKLNIAINELSDRDQRIIRMRYGFDGPCMSFDEIGRKMGRTKQAIHQREGKIIRRLNDRLTEMLDFELLSEYFMRDDFQEKMEEIHLKSKRK